MRQVHGDAPTLRNEIADGVLEQRDRVQSDPAAAADNDLGRRSLGIERQNRDRHTRVPWHRVIFAKL